MDRQVIVSYADKHRKVGSAAVNAEDEDRAVAHVIDRLAERFPGMPRTSIERAVQENREALAGGRVRDYIPVLIEHGAKEQLRHETPSPA